MDNINYVALELTKLWLSNCKKVVSRGEIISVFENNINDLCEDTKNSKDYEELKEAYNKLQKDNAALGNTISDLRSSTFSKKKIEHLINFINENGKHMEPDVKASILSILESE